MSADTVAVDLTFDADAFRAAIAHATEAFGVLRDAISGISRQHARVFDAARWRTDVPPTRWRDWLPSGERPVERARRLAVDRAMRARARRAHRHGRVLR